MAEVLDLRTRSIYLLDYAALARRRILSARRALDLSAAAFAEMLTPLVGWPVSTEAVEAWETNTVPPGDVLVAVGNAISAASRTGSLSGVF
jgi:DNA-binding transcriptional regulator YiaG